MKASDDSAEREPPSDAELEITLSRFPDPGWLEVEWKALEAKAAGGFSFFQSWIWVGCLFVDRFSEPVLLRATHRGETVGLALFNRRGSTLFLSESGDPRLDAPFIEHNGPLILGEPAIAARLLRSVWNVSGISRLVLSGVAPGLPTLAAGHMVRLQAREAAYVDLGLVHAAGGDYLAGLSRNTRQQLRRSLRHYGSQRPLLIAAETADQAAAWLDALIGLHTASWRRRGKLGAFADPFMSRFHHALVGRALAAGSLDLLQCRTGESVLGYLYNFRTGPVVYAYQSGLQYSADSKHVERPGLVCHLLAIERALAAGAAAYDFLAGGARYKNSLANAGRTLVWTVLDRHLSRAALGFTIKQQLRRLADAWTRAGPKKDR